MSFFDDIGSFFSGSTGGSWVGPAIGAASIVAGSLISSNANSEAADRVAQGEREKAAAIQAGNVAAQQRFDDVKAQTEPGVTALRDIVSRGTGLTPEQTHALDDQRRQLPGTLARTSLRGSGRAITAAIKQTENDFVRSAQDANRRTSDSAAGTLAGANFSASGSQAGLDASTGRALGESASDAGSADAGATLGTGRIAGQAIGDIASIISTDRKRASRYDSTLDRLRKTLGEDNQDQIR